MAQGLHFDDQRLVEADRRDGEDGTAVVDATRRANVDVKRHRRPELDVNAILSLDDVTTFAAIGPEVESDTVGNVVRRHLFIFWQKILSLIKII